MTSSKEKRPYSVWSNIAFSFSTYLRYVKSAVVFCGVGTAVRVILPFAGIYLPKVVIDSLTAQVSAIQFIQNVGVMVLLLVLLSFLKSYSDIVIDDAFGTYGSYYFHIGTFEKYVTMDYELMEDPEFKKIEDKASRAGSNNHTAAMNLPRNLSNVAVNLFGLLLYGGVIVYVSPWIIALLAASALINWLALSAARRYEERTREGRSKIDRKIRYILTRMRTLGYAKDIRLYTMRGFLSGMLGIHLSEKESAQAKVENRELLTALTGAFLVLLRDGAAYAFLIWLLLSGRMALGDFVMIFAAIGTLASWVSGILVGFSDFMRSHSEMTDLRSFLDLPDRSNTGAGKPLPPKESPPGFILTDVSYTYPNASIPALRDISVEIKPGERVAVVGENGAGKTTLVKLLCGLYAPKRGEIRMNGVDIKAYNRDDYFTLFSTVFQDIHLTTAGIIGNISSATPERTDTERLTKCLKLSGLYDKVRSLPGKEYTGIVRQTDENAVELSGGELQKLALARALYKDAPVMILDEPTAALDPIAENEVYRKYAELTAGKTSVYISHRLASTRFCDRILFLDGQTVAEQGTHDELMRLGGKYAHMFNIQSSYYAEGKQVTENAR